MQRAVDILFISVYSYSMPSFAGFAVLKLVPSLAYPPLSLERSLHPSVEPFPKDGDRRPQLRDKHRLPRLPGGMR